MNEVIRVYECCEGSEPITRYVSPNGTITTRVFCAVHGGALIARKTKCVDCGTWIVKEINGSRSTQISIRCAECKSKVKYKTDPKKYRDAGSYIMSCGCVIPKNKIKKKYKSGKTKKTCPKHGGIAVKKQSICNFPLCREVLQYGLNSGRLLYCESHKRLVQDERQAKRNKSFNPREVKKYHAPICNIGTKICGHCIEPYFPCVYNPARTKREAA